jgi:amidase
MGLAEQTRWLDATEQAHLVAAGEVTALELVEAAIERIEAFDPVLNAVVLSWFDEARKTAQSVPSGGMFGGVPFLLKDLVAAYAGQPLCSGNLRLKQAAIPAAADSTVVGRFRAAGLITLGRTNTPEFGSLAQTTSTAWGATANPWDTARTPGGSSGGSAAAVAAGLVPIAHGSDGAGSLRMPASACGLVGLKPSQGRITAGPAGDETGPGVQFCLSRSVRDTAAMLDAMAGPGIGDTIIAPPPAGCYTTRLAADPPVLRIGMLDHLPTGGPVHPDCATAVHTTARLLDSLGHHLEPDYPAPLAWLPGQDWLGVLRATAAAAGLASLGQALGREVTADDVEARNWDTAQHTRGLTALDHARALAGQVEFRRAVAAWWADGYDLLLTPTLPAPPAPLDPDAATAVHPRERRSVKGTPTVFTQAFNCTGQPAISLPLHQSSDGLPIGVQLIAAYGREDLLINIAAQLEHAQPWTTRHP